MKKLGDFRWQAFMILLAVIIMGTSVSLFMIFELGRTEKSMLEQQKYKLIHIADLFDKNFEGSYKDILLSQGLQNAPKEEQLKVLNKELKELAAQFSELYPGIDVGCYSSELNSIIVGGTDYGYYLAGEFTEQEKVINKALLRDKPLFIKSIDEIQYLKPLVRYGKTIGVVWAAEDLSKVYTRVNNIRNTIYYIFLGSLLLSLSLAILLIMNYMRNIKLIKASISGFSSEFKIEIPEISGELGEISQSLTDLREQLIEVRALNDLVVENVDEGITVLDAQNKVVLANNFAEEVFSTIEKPENYDLKNYLEKEEGNIKKLTWLNNGESKILLVDKTPIKADGFQGTIVTFKDITSEEKYEQKIRASERFAALGKMVAGVAHEIRNPLTSIAGYIDYWKKRGTENLSPDALETISKEIQRLNNLLEKLLFFAKSSNIKFEEINIEEILKEIINFISTTYPSVLFEYEFEPLPSINGAREQLRSAFENIIFNAVQALEGVGKISLTAKKDEERNGIIIIVKDTGIGIPSENISYVFDPFFSTKSKGTGLGLAITYEIVKLHQGEIEIESIPEEGTSVKVFLPTREDDTDE